VEEKMYELQKDYFYEVECVDPELALALYGECRRQREQLDLNAGENYVSPAVLKALGSPMTNKYSDGYPGRRGFAYCQNMDTAENLAISRLKEIYGAEHANVQSNSGGDANMIVYYAALEPGDTVLGPSLSQGGQMSHGNPRNFSGRFFKYVPFTLNRYTERLDYDVIRKAALEHHPRLIVFGSTTYPRDVDHAAFREIADETGAYYLADVAQFAGLIAGGVMNNPVPYADFVTASTHKTLRGPRGGIVLCPQKYAKMIDDAAWPGTQGSPQMNTIAAKAVCFKEAMQPAFREYQAQTATNARTLASELQNGGIHVSTGGTDSHIVSIDVTRQGRTGNEVREILNKCNILATFYRTPFEQLPDGQVGGVRLATSCLTTRGMRKQEMLTLARCITDAVIKGEAAINENLRRVSEMTESFPLY